MFSNCVRKEFACCKSKDNAASACRKTGLTIGASNFSAKTTGLSVDSRNNIDASNINRSSSAGSRRTQVGFGSGKFWVR